MTPPNLAVIQSVPADPGVQAHSLGVVTWAVSSFVEALASLIVVWRFTGPGTLSTTSEARAQRWVAASFFALAPYPVIETIRKLVNGGETRVTVLAVGLTLSAITLMPLRRWAKLRFARAIAAIALKEDRQGWRGESTCCTPMSAFASPVCHEDCCP